MSVGLPDKGYLHLLPYRSDLGVAIIALHWAACVVRLSGNGSTNVRLAGECQCCAELSGA